MAGDIGASNEGGLKKVVGKEELEFECFLVDAIDSSFGFGGVDGATCEYFGKILMRRRVRFEFERGFRGGRWIPRGGFGGF